VCFGSVFKTRIGRHRVVACGEVDCFDPATKAKPGMENASYVELKVTKQQTTDRDVSSFERFKLLKWYCQSFIAGVPRIVCGFRDDRGTLHNTQTFNTTEIPPMLKSKYSPAAPPWDHRRLVSFLDQVLTWLSAEVVDEDATYELSYDGNARQSTLQLAPSHRLPDEEIRTELYL
jgi:RAT1-interacting protein